MGVFLAPCSMVSKNVWAKSGVTLCSIQFCSGAVVVWVWALAAIARVKNIARMKIAEKVFICVSFVVGCVGGEDGCPGGSSGCRIRLVCSTYGQYTGRGEGVASGQLDTVFFLGLGASATGRAAIRLTATSARMATNRASLFSSSGWSTMYLLNTWTICPTVTPFAYS